MNDLSLFIYLADVAGDLDWFFGLLFFISSTLLIFTVCLGLFVADDLPFTEKDWKAWRKCMLFSSIITVTSFICGALTPEQDTVYAIAASEMGEEFIKTEEVGLARQALQNWLEDQIEEKTE